MENNHTKLVFQSEYEGRKMANTKILDKSKKSNIKCEHCIHYEQRQSVDVNSNFIMPYFCKLTNIEKNYWNRCKQFEWK